MQCPWRTKVETNVSGNYQPDLYAYTEFDLSLTGNIAIDVPLGGEQGHFYSFIFRDFTSPGYTITWNASGPPYHRADASYPLPSTAGVSGGGVPTKVTFLLAGNDWIMVSKVRDASL